MTIFQGYDGELRLYSYGSIYGADAGSSTYYLEVLFCEMDFSGPLARPHTEENLIITRGRFDADARYIEGADDPRYEPVDFSFSCRLADTVNTRVLTDWISGVTKITGTTQLYSFKGKTTIDGITLPVFSDSTRKYAYRIEMKWDGTNDYGLRYEEVYFPPQRQSIRESPDGLMLNCGGMIYGDVTRITTFTASTISII